MTFRDNTNSASRRRDESNRRRSANDLDHQWKVRVFRLGSQSGPVSVNFSFPTRDGRTNEICVSYSELRHRTRLLDQLANHLPLFPRDVGPKDSKHFAFIQELVAAQGDDRIDIEPDRTGFLDQNTFVTFSEIIKSDGTIRDRHLLNNPSNPQQDDDVRGSLKEAKQTVLKLARKSSYLAFTIGVGLTTPLPGYVEVFRREKPDIKTLLSETAVFNLSGDSSSGKTKAGLAAMSLAGSPNRAETLDASRRALAEMASDSNGLPFVLDDTEKTEDGVLVETLKSIVHMVTGGRSKRISRGVDQTRFPDLRWSTFGLSSSPRPIAELAAEAGWAMTLGDKVRLFDISVPRPECGGIFDRVSGTQAERAKKSVHLIKELEDGYQSNRGHVFRAWLPHLMREDRTEKIMALVERFVDRVCIDNQGWEVRFAQKFGIVYAAMILGISAGILPWTRKFAFSVTKKCYRDARKSASGEKHSCDVLQELKRLIDDHSIVVPSQQKSPIELSTNDVILIFKKDGRRKFGVLDPALKSLLGFQKASAFIKALAIQGILAEGHGQAGTRQERVPIVRDGLLVKKPRMWVVDAKQFEKHLKRARR
jgi:Domain of unknown function (DUF927)